MSRADGELSQASEDAVITRLLQRLAELGHYQGVMECIDPADRPAIDAAVERHAARRRAAGEPGW